LTLHKTLSGHNRGAISLGFRGDSKQLAVGTGFGRIHLWDVITGAPLRSWKGHEGIIYSIQYSPEGGRLLTAGHDTLARVWEAGSGEGLLTLKGHKEAVAGAVYTPDGKRIVTGSGDNTVRVWDARTGK
jgi:WD40 repeat protein